MREREKKKGKTGGGIERAAELVGGRREGNADTTEGENREKKRREPQADGLAELSSRGETEPEPTAVRTYYHKRNNGE